jgi:hypothetical protein
MLIESFTARDPLRTFGGNGGNAGPCPLSSRSLPVTAVGRNVGTRRPADPT